MTTKRASRATKQISAPACDLAAIPKAKRAGHRAAARALAADEDAIRNINGGYRIELPAERLPDVLTFVESERRCCRHLRFEIVVPENEDSVILTVLGIGARHSFDALVLAKN